MQKPALHRVLYSIKLRKQSRRSYSGYFVENTLIIYGPSSEKKEVKKLKARDEFES